MSLASPESPSPPTASRRRARLVVVALFAVAAVAAGVGIAIVMAGPDEHSARAAVVALWHRRYDAAVARDAVAYLNTVDPARKFLRDCETQSFDAYLRSDAPPGDVPEIARVERWGQYFRVWVSTEHGLLRRFARQDAGRWYVSEPFPTELGARVTKEYAGVKVRYYTEDGLLANAVGADLSEIVGRVLSRATETPPQLFELQIATLSDPGGECFVAGSAERSASAIIVVNDLRLTAGYDHVSNDTAATIEHEALHWLQDEHAARMKMKTLPHWWVIEGWPTLLTTPPTQSERQFAMCTSPPSYDDVQLGPLVNASVEDVERDYIVAAMLVERLFGSWDSAAYWSFFDDFGRTDPYVRATGSNGGTFYKAWLEEARRLYC